MSFYMFVFKQILLWIKLFHDAFFSFTKVILRMFIEGPFKVDGLCKQVDTKLWHYHKMWGRSQITVNVKQKKKHFSKLAGASSAPRLEWLTSAVPGWRLASSASSTSRQPLQSSHLQPTNNPPVAAAARTVIWWTPRTEHSEAVRQPTTVTSGIVNISQPALPHLETSLSRERRGNYNGSQVSSRN